MIIGFLLFISFVPVLLHSQPMIIYFGDSVTEGWINASLKQESSFPTLTDSILARSGQHLVSMNKGIGGNTTVDALNRIGRDVLYNYPDIVVLEFGWNDCLLTTEGLPRVEPVLFRLNIQRMLRLFKDARVSAVVLGLNNVDSSRFYKYFDSTAYLEHGGITSHILVYDDILKEVADNFGATYIRVEFPRQAESGFFAFDGMHPSSIGHRRIAKDLAPVISDLISLPASSRYCPLLVYPQPFIIGQHEDVVIRYGSGTQSHSLVMIFDNNGSKVYEETDNMNYGFVRTSYWNGRLTSGRCAPPGVYTVVVQTSERLNLTKIIIR